MNDSIPLVNIKNYKRNRAGEAEERLLRDEGSSSNIRYMERNRGNFKNSTGFLKKIFYGISFSILGIGSVFLLMVVIRLLGFGGGTGEMSIENYVDVVGRYSKNSNLNIKNGDLLTPLLVERVVGSENHKKVQEFIVNHFTGLQWEMEKDTFEDNTPLGLKTFTNYIFTKNPVAEKRIVLAAHYDSKYFENGGFIGATDSAVPCAILMDIAENLNFALENQQKRIESKEGKEALRKSTTIQMIFFDGEEAFQDWTNTDSIYGAKHLANKWEYETLNSSTTITKLQSIDVFVLLDLLGAAKPTFTNYYKSSEKYFNSLAEVETILNKQNMLSTSSVSKYNSYFMKSEGLVSTTKLFIDDDHKPFLRKNVPILHLIPYPFPDVWHKLDDNADALDQDTIKDLAIILKLFIVKQLQLNMY
ncbi:hypothetical protein BCR32DRAFT_325538 [Anaeromyces robustus]|uniref:Peptide hydrolase n=1 Tax=Anaeromyces robustus TaxID=1754192 RepID=A0A1Y1XHP9_9FUNG|nr:hypothetical protein BCR32DRAFT_325538 [Anaeromyces robustus]|eukprot:ORX85267.1 hypothetical protein BCR32DRAFT_325538 [Anaeromyces robustus]